MLQRLSLSFWKFDNTGNDFIYPDNHSESLDTYLRYTGQVDSGGRRHPSRFDQLIGITSERIEIMPILVRKPCWP